MQKKFFVFEMSGAIICEIKNFKNEDCALKAIAPNGKFLALQFGDIYSLSEKIELVKIIKVKSTTKKK